MLTLTLTLTPMGTYDVYGYSILIHGLIDVQRGPHEGMRILQNEAADQSQQTTMLHHTTAQHDTGCNALRYGT